MNHGTEYIFSFGGGVCSSKRFKLHMENYSNQSIFEKIPSDATFRTFGYRK